MKKKKTIVAFVLDETGSMISNKTATISGFNEYLESLRNSKENVSFVLTKFNSQKIDIASKLVPIKEVKKLTDESYKPNDCTPLYDAIGKTIATVDGENFSDTRVLFVIMTDGQENDSKEFTKDKIKDLIKAREEKDWTFVFLGANQDAWAEGFKFGINWQWNTITYNQNDMPHIYRTLTSATSCYLSSDVGSAKEFFKSGTKENDQA